MTSSRSLGCCRSKTWRITSRIGACQTCLHLMFTFTDVCACEIHRREVNEVCRCACPDGIAPSKVGTSDDVCDDFLISAKIKNMIFLLWFTPKGGWGCLMSPSCLDSRGFSFDSPFLSPHLFFLPWPPALFVLSFFS